MGELEMKMGCLVATTLGSCYSMYNTDAAADATAASMEEYSVMICMSVGEG